MLYVIPNYNLVNVDLNQGIKLRHMLYRYNLRLDSERRYVLQQYHSTDYKLQTHLWHFSACHKKRIRKGNPFYCMWQKKNESVKWIIHFTACRKKVGFVKETHFDSLSEWILHITQVTFLSLSINFLIIIFFSVLRNYTKK